MKTKTDDTHKETLKNKAFTYQVLGVRISASIVLFNEG